jgi:hypothetical protein
MKLTRGQFFGAVCAGIGVAQAKPDINSAPVKKKEIVITVSLPTLHSAQQKVVDEASRLNVLTAGRRWGKGVLGCNICSLAALRGSSALWVFSNPRTLEYELHKTGKLLRKSTLSYFNTQRICLHGGGQIQFSMAGEELRGRPPVDTVVIDEPAWIGNMQLTVNQLLRELPSNGQLWLIGTPNSTRENDFAAIYEGAIGRGQRRWQMPTNSNPFMGPEIEHYMRHYDFGSPSDSLHKLTKRVYASEYMAEFV